MVFSVCNLEHIESSSYHAGLENIWFVLYAIWDILKLCSQPAGLENIWFVGSNCETVGGLTVKVEEDIQTNYYFIYLNIMLLPQ